MDSFKSAVLNMDKNRLSVFTDRSKLENGEAGFGVFFKTPVKHAVGQKLGPQHQQVCDKG